MDLYKTAKQLFQVLDLTEAPETNWSDEETKGYIEAAAKQILPEDQIPDDLKGALAELGFDLMEQVKEVNKARSTIEGKREKPVKEKKEKIVKEKETNGVNIWGRRLGSIAAKIDELLSEGNTKKDIATAIDRPESWVTSHIRFCTNKQSFKVVEEEKGKFRLLPPQSE